MKTALPMPKRVLALDYGHKRVGVAVSDALLLMAHGRDTVLYRTREELFAHLHELIRKEDIGLVVVGLPRNMNGSEGEMARTVREFISKLKARLQLPVVAWDERLSSRQAQRVLAESGMRQRRQRETVDQLAAVYILQSYLDSGAVHR